MLSYVVSPRLHTIEMYGKIRVSGHDYCFNTKTKKPERNFKNTGYVFDEWVRAVKRQKGELQCGQGHSSKGEHSIS